MAEAYTSIQKKEPDFKLDKDALTSWTYALLGAGHAAEAIEIGKFTVQQFPTSPAYSALGDAFWLSGQKDAALDCYRNALAMSPDDVFLKPMLKELESNVRTSR